MGLDFRGRQAEEMLKPLTGGGSAAWGGTSAVVIGLSSGDAGTDEASDAAGTAAAGAGIDDGVSTEAVAGSTGSLLVLPPS